LRLWIRDLWVQDPGCSSLDDFYKEYMQNLIDDVKNKLA
jgi:hypothetical protein